MILAAGLGTRLKPLTDHKPKALVEIEGEPVLEILIKNLRKQGFDNIIINVHHFADSVIKFINSKDFGVKIVISDESDELLDTGGGLVKALPLLFEKDDEPVLVHNVDILGNAQLKQLIDSHKKNNAFSTLLISERESGRKLIFSQDFELKGWHNLATGEYRPEKPSISNIKEYAFNGIYVMNKEAISEMNTLCGKGKFSVMEYFLHPLRKGKTIGVVQKDLELIDIGKPATLAQAPELLNKINRTY